MYMKKILLLIIAVISVSFVTAQDLRFSSLKCEMMESPLSVDTSQPAFSWIVQADGFDRSQSAYEIIVATDIDRLTSRKADMWKSGKVRSSQSAFVRYAGKSLKPLTSYYWMVRVWDEDGKSSKWSAPAKFETGLMDDESQWHEAKWITLSNDSRKSEHRFREFKTGAMKEPVMVTSQPVGYFRNEALLDKEIKSARAYICGLGYYELYINGKKVGDHVLDPAPSNYDKQAYYVAYDVTGNLSSGKNTLGIILGNGFYGQNISWKNNPEADKNLSFGAPAARMVVKVEYTDGTGQYIVTDGEWKNSTGPIVFDNIYGGEIYDSRYSIEGWNRNGYDDSQWTNTSVVTPEIKKVSAQNMPPIRVLEEIKPVKMFKASDGKWIIDYGKNIAGWVKIKASGKAGDVLKISTYECLTQDGKDVFAGSTGGSANGMAQWFKYIFSGNGVEEWEPRFSYHGFRYAKVDEGIEGKPSEEMVTAVLVATDIQQNGSFLCSEPLYNKMDTISRLTIVDNIHGIPEDCPHREKCGWLGDAHAFCEYALYNYDMLNFYKKYMQDIRTQCRPSKAGDKSGKIFRVPTMIAPGKRTSNVALIDWGVATVYLPWYNYIHYGDDSMIKEFYPTMKELMEYYLTFKDKDGIMQNGMGDWCPPLWDRKNNPSAMECHPVISANAYFYDVLGIMARFAKMNGDDDYANKMQTEQKQLFDAFNKVYLKRIPLSGALWYGSQTATVMALRFGMVPEDKIKDVVEGLVYDIEAVKGMHHAVGIHGMRYIYTVLAEYGFSDLAHTILTIPTFPSQTYIMNYGFTTWPERQFYWDMMPQLSNSLNHPMHSGFAAYFYEMIGGVQSSRQAPGYKEFYVNPVSPSGMTFAKVTVPTVYGNIKSDWEKKGDEFILNVSVPFNTKAHVSISQKQYDSLKINDKQISDSPSIKYDSENQILILGSGDYKLITKN